LKYLLDTCLVSELVRERPDQGVLEWIEQQDEQALFLSVLTLGELHKGVAKLPDGRKKSQLRHWLDDDLQTRFSGRMLDIDASIATLWGRIQGEAEQRGSRMPVIDSLLAATAQANGLAVVTRNGTDMAGSGVEIINPWKN
jgi:predicted nucleic acid-binding protein